MRFSTSGCQSLQEDTEKGLYTIQENSVTFKRELKFRSDCLELIPYVKKSSNAWFTLQQRTTPCTSNMLGAN